MNKMPRNDKGQRHGYWEMYYDKGGLSSKGYYENGLQVDYWVDYWQDGSIAWKGHYYKGVKVGYWYERWVDFGSGSDITKVYFII